MIPEPFSPERFERFFRRVIVAPAPCRLSHLGDCWLWIGAADADGYGRFHCPGFPAMNGGTRNKNVYAHRWCTAFWYGTEILNGLTYDHLCRRPACVNPRHGSAITVSQNVARGNVTRHEIEDPDFEF